jgi:hypothetical protein
MARSRKKSGGLGASRAPRSQSRKKPTPIAVEVEVVEEEKGLGMEDAVIIVTTIILLVAFLMIDKDRGKYGEGLFFQDSGSSAPVATE